MIKYYFQMNSIIKKMHLEEFEKAKSKKYKSLLENLEIIQYCLNTNFTSVEKLMLYFTDDKEFPNFI